MPCVLGWVLLNLLIASNVGCGLLPDVKHKQQFINPFPQIRTVAVLPFVNQSEEPTLSGDRVALAYINELQAIPGFEVLPLGAVKSSLEEYNQPLACGADFQAFARYLGVDAVLLGSVVDFTPYYPPRMSIKVNWYAANPAFHPVLPGYGLPWGTKDEKKIPRWIHIEAQRALAAEQLRTQTPEVPAVAGAGVPSNQPNGVPAEPLMPEDQADGPLVKPVSVVEEIKRSGDGDTLIGSALVDNDGNFVEPALPPEWPDARGFIPDAPAVSRPPAIPQSDPIISHMRNYNGHDDEFAQRVADYYFFRDDSRFGGWQAYLQRSEDFIRVCCYMHITETLASRGGEDESRLVLRWPIERYHR